MSAPTRRARWLRFGLIATAAVALAACPPDVVDPIGDLFPGNPLHELTLGIVLAAPCDEEGVPAGRAGEIYVDALTGGPTFENEIHDCQRLIRPDNTFGPLMGIFPNDGAMAEDSLLPGPVAVGTIFSWGVGKDRGTEGYAPLQLEADFRWGCLWIDARRASAAIVPLPTSEAKCEYGQGTAPTDLPLTVQADPIPIPGDSVVPTARWRWDPGTESYYIGIKCGVLWCSVYAEPGVLPTVTMDFGVRGIRQVGDFDEQRLAVRDGDTLVVGPMAWIVPVSGLERRKFGDFATADTVAHILVDESSADPRYIGEYVRAYGLETLQGSPLGGSILGANLVLSFHNTVLGGTEGAASAIPPSGGATTLRFEYRSNVKHAAMGTTRFRWRDVDEGIWVSCARGCCTVFEF